MDCLQNAKSLTIFEDLWSEGKDKDMQIGDNFSPVSIQTQRKRLRLDGNRAFLGTTTLPTR